MSFLPIRRTSLPIPCSKDQPGHSILLNSGSCEQEALHANSNSNPTTVSPSGSSTSVHSTTSSATSTCRAPNAASSSSCKVSFAPLPQVPPEMKRRNSITLGVAARKQLLSGPNGGGGGTPRSAGNGGTELYMSEEDWELYKKQFEEKNGSQPVDLGEMAKSGARSLWRRVRSSSYPPPSSTTSDLSEISPGTNDMSSSPFFPASPRKGLFSSLRKDPPSSLPTSNSATGTGLGTVPEEKPAPAPSIAGSPSPEGANRESFQAWTQSPGSLHSSKELEGEGDETPRRLGSPSPPELRSMGDEKAANNTPDHESPASPTRSKASPPVKSMSQRSEQGSSSPNRPARDSAVLGFDSRRFPGVEASGI